jgi:hypothetical protein
MRASRWLPTFHSRRVDGAIAIRRYLLLNHRQKIRETLTVIRQVSWSQLMRNAQYFALLIRENNYNLRPFEGRLERCNVQHFPPVLCDQHCQTWLGKRTLQTPRQTPERIKSFDAPPRSSLLEEPLQAHTILVSGVSIEQYSHCSTAFPGLEIPVFCICTMKESCQARQRKYSEDTGFSSVASIESHTCILPGGIPSSHSGHDLPAEEERAGQREEACNPCFFRRA